MKSITIGILSILCAPSLAAESVILTPTKDSDVYSFLNVPTGSTFDLGVSNTPEGQTGLHSQKSLIQFDLSASVIPAGEIGGATLRLFVLEPDSTEGGGFRPGNLAVFRQGAAWGPVTSTHPSWNTIQAAGEAVAIVPVAETGVWIDIDVTPTVLSWASGAEPNHGFVLQCETDPAPAAATTNLLFASMELGNAALEAGLPEDRQYFPKLVITRAGTPPVLSVAREGGNLLLSWPEEGGGWTLEQAESPAGPWTGCEYPVVPDGGTLRVTAPLSDAPRAFFRLTDGS